MNYAQHFIKGQKVILKPAGKDSDINLRHDNLFAIVSACTDSILEISFPEPFSLDTNYPFTQNKPFKILSEDQDMGISVHSTFKEHCNGNTIRLNLVGDLNHFNRRCNHRIELKLWVGLEESPVSHPIIQERWQHQIKQLRRNNSRPNTANFAERDISLSSSGIGVNYSTPVQPGCYFMVYLDLNDDSALICTVGEVVRCEPGEDNSFFIGLHFDYMEEGAQQRLDLFINHQCQQRH